MDYLKVQISWGATWGATGFFLLLRGENGHSFWSTIEEESEIENDWILLAADKQAWCWRVPSSFWSTLVPSGKRSSCCRTVCTSSCATEMGTHSAHCVENRRDSQVQGVVVDVPEITEFHERV